MSSRRGGNRTAPADDPQSEVEQLLRAAEDDLLLKLRVGSSSSSFDPDLARRLEALKSPPPPPSSAVPRQAPASRPAETVGSASAASADEELGKVLGDDLSARFAALKASSSGPRVADLGTEKPDLVRPEARTSHIEVEEDGDDDRDDDGVSKKEVDKLMQWAMDAARLDPSKSDDETDGGVSGSSEDEEEEGDLELKKKKVEERNKMNGKPKKWFFF
ncbi:hypothetical protein Cni_G06792 [Canna indica]|uniref:Uncharacterized protein n=1 Tax=Canna indica TaxID=4628 RepID=A0AAQ3JXR3_9LILI|nr:hypothetical protein Cni_G06792 [Canna indica]